MLWLQAQSQELPLKLDLDVPLDLDFDECAQTNWEARAIFNRRSSSNLKDTDWMVDASNGSQAEWEARASWGLPSRRPSQQMTWPSQGSSTLTAIQTPICQGLTDMQTESQAELQQEDGVASASEQKTSSESQVGLQRVTKQAAATAALQQALSNIQYIATGSQKARAAVAEAAAEAESDALSQMLRLDSELLQGCSQSPFDNGPSQVNNGFSASNKMGSTADMLSIQAASAAQQGGRNSAHKQMGILGAVSSVQAAAQAESGGSTPELADMPQGAADAQLGLQPTAAECSLAEESSSNGSHFSLDSNPSPTQIFDLAGSMDYAAMQLVHSAAGAGPGSQSEGNAEGKGHATLWSAAPVPYPGDGQCLENSSAALNVPAPSETPAESGPSAQADSVLMHPTRHMLPLSTQEMQLRTTSTAHASSSEQLGSDVGHIQLPSPGDYSQGGASIVAPAGISGTHVSTQAPALEGTAGWQAPDTILLLHSPAQSASSGGLVAVLHQGCSSSDASPHAALQPRQGSSITDPPSEVMSLGDWAPPRLAQQACEQPLSVDKCSHQVSEHFMEPSKQEAADHDTAEMKAHGSDHAWLDQQGGRRRTSLTGDAGNVGGIDARALAPQVSKSSALCHVGEIGFFPDAAFKC